MFRDVISSLSDGVHAAASFDSNLVCAWAETPDNMMHLAVYLAGVLVIVTMRGKQCHTKSMLFD